MEDLNKQQIILLCILISFVVSIATGIMTTSLLMEAPVQLTQTVNRVVERTIETVTPAPTVTNPNPVSKQIETVVINEDESITSAISKNSPSIVRIRETNVDGTVDNLYGLGVIVSKEGIIASDKKPISSVMEYIAITSDNTEIPLEPILTDKKSQVGFFKAKPVDKFTFVPVRLFTADLKLGQTIISVGGDRSNAISVGRVVSLNTKDVPAVGTSTPIKYVSSIVGDTAPEDGVAGAPVISLSGDVVGMSLSSFSSAKSYLPSALIKQEFDSIVIVQ